MKWTLKVGAAIAAAFAVGLAACSSEQPSSGAGAKPETPEGQVAVAPEGQTMSPGAVTRSLEGRGFTPTSVRRRGGTYVVDARGPSGNDVRMVVDGRAGQIRGMDVRRWAPGQRRIARGSRGNQFVNDTYEFGVTLEDAMLADWVAYEEAAWAEEAAWIEYEEAAEWEWAAIEYEAAVEDLAYDEWVAEYGEVEAYEDSFYEEEYWAEAYGDEEIYYEDEEVYEEDLTADYGEEYYAGYDEAYYEEQGYEEDIAYEEDVYADEAYDDGGGYDEGYDDGGGYDEGGEYYDDGGGYDDGGDY